MVKSALSIKETTWRWLSSMDLKIFLEGAFAEFPTGLL